MLTDYKYQTRRKRAVDIQLFHLPSYKIFAYSQIPLTVNNDRSPERFPFDSKV